MKHTISEISVSYRPAKALKPAIITSRDSLALFYEFFPEDTIHLQERFMVMYLNRANRVIGVYPVSVGGITGTVADIRLILSVALKTAATSLIMAHNHPSGNLMPSQADIALTRKTKEAASYMDIKVLDHIIISPEDGLYYSFTDEGML